MTPSVLHLLPLMVVLLAAAAADAATFTVTNNCPYTVWAAAVPGGGQQLDNGQTWSIDVPAGTTGGAHGCQTGDCGGVLRCTGYGQPPNTLAEFGLNQYQGQDFFDISLVQGFNVPMDFLPAGDGAGCPKGGPRCDADVTAQCPAALQVPGGCDNPCTVFRTDQYCCTGSAANNCGPTDYSKFFKGLCPDAYSYPKDDATSTYTCPGGTNYNVI
ncbi:hypothetical protein U9M48_010100 [Paspalum notatum var. saurae]|uniref:Thaumatin-like protein n=1 Tax=Paspalum notatum var. saurae TaxID=547442 RepID=A0AAQ3WFV1_PASNO